MPNLSISVVVPVYNTSKYLQQCYESLDSSYIDEIIFVNDGSTDHSLDILNQLSKQDSRIKIISKVNEGLSIARNTGIKAVTKPYYLLLDSDDTINTALLTDLETIVSNQDVDVISFLGAKVTNDMTLLGHTIKHPVDYNTVITGNQALTAGFHPSSACFFLYKKDFILAKNLWFTSGIMQEDVEFTVRMMLANPRIIFTEIPLYNYFMREDSMTTTKSMDRIMKYNTDAVKVAAYIAANKKDFTDPVMLDTIEKNANNVSWNLLWKMYQDRNQYKKEHATIILDQLSSQKLYPIKGQFKTKFQQLSSILINIRPLYLMAFKK